MRWRVISSLIIAILIFPAPLLAQQATPTAENATDAHTLLPSGIEFGLGWEFARYFAVSSDPAIFVDSAAAIYVGPAGTRIMIVVWINENTRTAIQNSWADPTEWFEIYRGAIEITTTQDRKANFADPPNRCVEARRSVGKDVILGLPAGETLCAVGVTHSILTIVFGSWDGVEGAEASDSVAELVAAGMTVRPLSR
jgi:hypothetical protein